MPFDSEMLANLTTALSGNIELYNKVLEDKQRDEADLAAKTAELESINTKFKESEQRGEGYLKQISNLLARIPVGEAQRPVTFEQKMEEIKKSSWAK